MGRSRNKQDQHAQWARTHADELSAIGLPLRVFETAERWQDFIANGHLDSHEDPARFSFEQLVPDQRAALHRFLERELAEGRDAAPLLTWLRVRAPPDFGQRADEVPQNAADAIDWLRSRGALAWLARHHEFVVEAAGLLLEGLRRELGVEVDDEHVLLGAALHDAGKTEHPAEMHGPGHAHERAGEEWLLRSGFPAHIARACVTHAAWSQPRATLEDRVIALADQLWKGKRDTALEAHLLTELAARVGRAEWEVFGPFDDLCARVAAQGPSRLRRSRIED